MLTPGVWLRGILGPLHAGGLPKVEACYTTGALSERLSLKLFARESPHHILSFVSSACLHSRQRRRTVTGMGCRGI